MEERANSIVPEKDEVISIKYVEKRPIVITNASAVILSVILCIVSALLCVELADANADLERANEQFSKLDEAASSFLEASDYLTSEARLYVETGNINYLANYMTEYEETKRRDAAVTTLKAEAGNGEASKNLSEALDRSNELAETEFYAMRLKADAAGGRRFPEKIEAVELKQNDSLLSAEAKDVKAREMLFGDEYNDSKEGIVSDVRHCSDELFKGLHEEIERLDHRSASLVAMTIATSVVLALLVIFVAFANYYLLVKRPEKKRAWEEYIS